jgi:hypothetical protein
MYKSSYPKFNGTCLVLQISELCIKGSLVWSTLCGTTKYSHALESVFQGNFKAYYSSLMDSYSNVGDVDNILRPYFCQWETWLWGVDNFGQGEQKIKQPGPSSVISQVGWACANLVHDYHTQYFWHYFFGVSFSNGTTILRGIGITWLSASNSCVGCEVLLSVGPDVWSLVFRV